MRSILVLLFVGLCNLEAVQAGEIRASFAMDADPEFHVPEPVKFVTPVFKPLWLQALARPEADLQRMTAETIAQAHEFGFEGMAEARPRLLEILSAEKSHPTARFAAARALIALDTRDAAPALFDASQLHGADLRQLIEPQLAIWKFQPLAAVWRARLTAGNVRYRELLLAIEGSATLGDQDAVPLLLKVMHDSRRSPAARLAAARAAGTLRDSGLEGDAAQLVANSNAPVLNRLCAGLLFARHNSEAARLALIKWAVDSEPGVAAQALSRLHAIDPDLVLPLADQAMQNADPKVRQLGADAYITRPNSERVVKLVRMLDDLHPDVRRRVCEALFTLSKSPEFNLVMRPPSMELLAGESWRGQEQAALLLGSLDHKAAAPRLVQLLESPRDEVLTTAAWGLRKLAVPETLPAILDKAQRQTAVREAQPVQSSALDAQVVHLFEAMGLMKYSPAEPLLRKHIPKNFGFGDYSRGAAIWSLGHLYADRPDETLVKLLVERMSDIRSIPPEMQHVQIMCAVSLGRMQAKSEIKSIRNLMGSGLSSAQPTLALRWAYMRLTGETLPPVTPARFSKSSWFLTPLDVEP